MAKGTTKSALVEGFRIQTIQDAALRVISARGLRGATMQEIADEAGVAKGTIYLYFKSREDLCQKTAEEAFRTLGAQLQEILDIPGPFPERLRALVRAMLGYFHTNREFFRLYFAMRFPEGEIQHATRHHRYVQPLYQQYLDRLARFLGGGMERGEVRRGDASRLALFLAEAVNAMILRRLTEPAPPPPDEDAEWITEVLLRGFEAPGGRP